MENALSRAEILCVGTELLMGDIVNTNAAFLSKRLCALGIGVYRQSAALSNGGVAIRTLSLMMSPSAG